KRTAQIQWFSLSLVFLRLTRASCGRVFCSPWQRCIDGVCSCKPPYMCPRNGVKAVCTRNHKRYFSYCQVTHAVQYTGAGFTPTSLTDYWSVPPGDGDVVFACRGAASAFGVHYSQISGGAEPLPRRCVNVRCQGFEFSLAECEIYNRVDIGDGTVAATRCYDSHPEDRGFICANDKRVSLNQTCDGVDDCGDRSDEMCCKKCRNGAFRCNTGVCVHPDAVGDHQLDCLGGEDETPKHLNTIGKPFLALASISS
uniref:SRCR domain-containing protein n=1 Tax=Oryzias sinensis TaxID=183150 RepID=A0A8C7Y720_9TELE